MATSPDGNGVLLFGGRTSTVSYLNSILELKADGQGWVGSWSTLTTKLQWARSDHIVIPVLMAKKICGLNGIVSTNTVGEYFNHLSIISMILETCMRVF